MKKKPNHETLLDKQELCAALNLPSTRSVDELIRRRRIPVIRIGYRTVRFSLPEVRAALTKLTVREE